jgi:hypothetical protein
MWSYGTGRLDLSQKSLTKFDKEHLVSQILDQNKAVTWVCNWYNLNVKNVSRWKRQVENERELHDKRGRQFKIG